MKSAALIRILLVSVIGTALCLDAGPLAAKSAEMMLVPTRVVLGNADHYATVTVKNSGDGIGRYRVDLVDATMEADGGVKLREDGSRDPFSALDILSISPRSITLKPDEYQTIRILVKNPESLAPGEYRSHLKVKMTENDLDAATGQPSPQAAGIQLKPKLVMVIPVIVRHGETSYQVSIDDMKLAPGAGGSPQLQMTFGFDGTQSVIGDVKVTHIDDNGAETVLKLFPGVAIYRGTAVRGLTVPLEIPQGVDIHKGKIAVAYMTQDKDNAKLMAQKDFTPR